MQQFRLTKYDPQYRDESGAYLLDEWTEFSDIGKTFNGVTLTADVYEDVESRYIAVACELLKRSSISSLAATNIESIFPSTIDPSDISIKRLPEVLRGLLRNQFWCRLTTNDGYFIHTGRDYYMYLGLPNGLNNVEEIVLNGGLFIEPFESPYRKLD